MLKHLALSRAMCLRQLQASLLKVVSKTLPSVSIRSRTICLARLMLNPEVNINPLLAGRKIDQEFLSRLAIQRDYYQEAADKEPTKLITDSDLPAMPFSKRDLPPDPRLKGAQGGPQPLHVMLADIIHTSLNGMKRRFIVYRDTAIALFAESQDMKKFPEWLMKDPRKMNE